MKGDVINAAVVFYFTDKNVSHLELSLMHCGLSVKKEKAQNKSEYTFYLTNLLTPRPNADSFNETIQTAI